MCTGSQNKHKEEKVRFIPTPELTAKRNNKICIMLLLLCSFAREKNETGPKK